MNLYDLHNEPASLDHHTEAYDQLPDIFWGKYKDKPAELKKREQYIAKSTEYSYLYTIQVLKGPFKAGEAVIAKSYYRGEYEQLVGYKI
jgi:hypothetical protein